VFQAFFVYDFSFAQFLFLLHLTNVWLREAGTSQSDQQRRRALFEGTSRLKNPKRL
jgi:hypothetical protein